MGSNGQISHEPVEMLLSVAIDLERRKCEQGLDRPHVGVRAW